MVKRFRSGEFNVLVATSIGEEGLDIGEVDLIICFDSPASATRQTQRFGRTGRKHEGRVGTTPMPLANVTLALCAPKKSRTSSKTKAIEPAS